MLTATFKSQPERTALAWKGGYTGHDKATCPVCNRRDFVGDDHTLEACWSCTNDLVNGILVRTRTGEIVPAPKADSPKLDILQGGVQEKAIPQAGRKPRVSIADVARRSIRAIQGQKIQGSRKGQ